MYLKRICSSIISILFFTLNISQMISIAGFQLEGWSEDIRLTNDDEGSHFPSIAVEGNNIHIVFSEYFSPATTSNRSLCYIRSLDNGDNWDTLRRIDTISGKAYDPKIAVSGPNVHIIWRDNVDYKIHYIRSTDNGISWSNETVISTESYLPYGNHNIAVYENNIYIAYVSINNKLTFIKSQDNGDTWGNAFTLVTDNSYAIDTGIAVYQNNIHIVWYDLYNRKGVRITHIYYINSNDDGNSWSSDINISTATGSTLSVSWPDIAVNEDKIYAVFCGQDDGGGNREIFYSYSEDNGINWVMDIQLSQSGSNTYNFYPSITLLGNNIYVAWFHSYVFLKSSSNGGINWTPDTRLSNITSYQSRPVMATNEDTVHIVWEDDRDGNTEIYYKKLPLQPNKININVDIDPDTLNLKSKGKWVTCYIELPEGYDVREINATSILLESTLSPILNPKYGFVESEDSYIVDHDGDGIPERMLKFDRAELEDFLTPSPQFELTITGWTYSNVRLEGKNIIKVL